MRALFGLWFVQSQAFSIFLKPQQSHSELESPISKLRRNDTQHLVKKVSDKQPYACTPQNSIFDLGFFDGGDSAAYLSSGYCVVGIEADPDLVLAANAKFAAQISTGQLRMMHAAVAPEGAATQWTTFYKSHCSKEWNSFYTTIGCRECYPPHAQNMTMCTAVQLAATDCTGIFTTYGTPHYLKLDIEGAETGCFQALGNFGGNPLPQFISAEITQLDYIDALHKLGYQGFKLVRQDHLNTVQASTGPWGDHAADCQTGAAWRTYAEVHAEFTAVLNKPLNPSEKCPGGVMPIHGEPKPATSYIWYDLHGSLTPPPAAR